MLQNVSDASRILRHGAQRHHEDILRGFGIQMQVNGARSRMHVLLNGQIQAGNGHRALSDKCVGMLGGLVGARGFSHVGFRWCHG